jgi:hypothetical protein
MTINKKQKFQVKNLIPVRIHEVLSIVTASLGVLCLVILYHGKQ